MSCNNSTEINAVESSHFLTQILADDRNHSGLQIYNNVIIPDHEIEVSAIRSQGAGGQNVNKLATAIHRNNW